MRGARSATWLVAATLILTHLRPVAAAEPAPPTLSLPALEQLASEHNPTLWQAAANIEAAQGRAQQAGLYPNPTVGYAGERIGAAGSAGEMQGMFIDQTIVTAGKLKLNRAKYSQEVTQTAALALAQQYRVVNSVRIRFYQLLAMQRLLDVRAELLKVAEDAVQTTEELFNVGAANKPDVLQARIEARQERVALENARTQYQAAWQQLVALVGVPELAPSRLDGDLETLMPVPDFDAALAHLLEASPEIHVALAELARTQIGLKREQVEPIPNVQVRVANGYDFETGRDVTSVQLGVRLPVFDKNQGNIRTARAQVAYAEAELCRVQLSLRQRLARAYARYRTAWATVQAYRKENLPEAKEAYELYLDSFRKRRAAWPQVLVAQRTYFQISVEYTEALADLRSAEVAILGLLLVDGLNEPPNAPSAGERRIDKEGALCEPINGRAGRGLENRVGGHD
ncbi:MAG TPA: TolC family protein [Gemmataceae bacterium]|jgi:cobalt-zinc-cadmium efflux system outer membrane protein|nr:TolC family protein [Gemmataceae bacterium]